MTQPGSRLAIVTGTSSGIGEAVALELLQRGWRVVGAARRRATIDNPSYTHLRLDLADLTATAAVVEEQVASLVVDAAVRRLALVNNAAHVGLLGPVDLLDPQELLKVYMINVAAPIWLMGWCVRRSRQDVPLRIVNVSSGAAVQPYPGLAAYCTSKAALRMAGMVLAAELDTPTEPQGSRRDATILSFEPGTVDTPMQASARATRVETLPAREVFIRLAAEGRLAPPAAPAGEIAEYIEGDGHVRFTERRFSGSPRLSAPAAQ